jgi:hypothetical protein
MKLSYVACAVMSLAMAACSPSEDVRLAEKEVDSFHDMFNMGAYDVLYVSTAKRFKEASSQEDFVSLLEQVHRSVGAVKRSDRQSWSVESNSTDGTVVKLKYYIDFEKGYADEEFEFLIQYSRATLAHYKVHWHALIAN